MKKLLLILLCLPMIGFGQVYIPDANFKAYLVGNTAINTNGDSEIQITEAADFDGIINCSNMNISDLTGVEEFASLEEFYCDSNQITDLDLQQNTSLRRVGCSYSPNLTTVNVDNLGYLEYLFCENNDSLTYLSMRYASIYNGTLFANLSHNNLQTIDWFGADIWDLSCIDNKLTSLNLQVMDFDGILNCSENLITNLIVGSSDIDALICSNNLITTLDISNSEIDMFLACNDNPYLTSLNIKNGENSEWLGFSALNTPLLTCITVDYVPYADTAWTVANGSIDSQHFFSTNCALPSELQEHYIKKDLLKVTDLLGRETKETNQPLYYLYDDGTVEKRIVIE